MYGAKHRMEESVDTVLQSINLGFQKYIERVVEKCPQPLRLHTMNRLLLWKQQILDIATTRFNNARTNLVEEHISQQDRTYLQRLKSLFTITPVDKLSHNLALTCKRLYQYSIHKEMTSRFYHSVTNRTVADVLESHRLFNQQHRFKHVPTLSYLYNVPKMHKVPIKMRVIAGVSKLRNRQPVATNDTPVNSIAAIYDRPPHSSENSTTACSKFVSKWLLRAMDILHAKSNQLLQACGCRTFWCIRSADEIFHEIKTNQTLFHDRHPRSFDFTAMYTQLPHNLIKTNVEDAYKEALEYYAANQADFSAIPAMPTLDIMMTYVHHIVDNKFFNNCGDHLTQQVIGLGMGENAAPELANLTLYVMERNKITTLIDQGNLDEARKHAHT
jgi:hypothetical protein